MMRLRSASFCFAVAVASHLPLFCESFASNSLPVYHSSHQVFSTKSNPLSSPIHPIFERRTDRQSTTTKVAMATGPSSLFFGKFKISPSQIFYTTNLSAAIVNLRPIVPGHVLIIPKRVTPRLHQLSNEEYLDLWQSVRTVQNAVEKYYNAEGSNVAVQDGVCAGQSVPHVHVHILPRLKGDFERNDDVYDELQDWAPRQDDKSQKQGKLVVLEDEDRRDRTEDEMEEEAGSYRNLFESNADAKF